MYESTAPSHEVYDAQKIPASPFGCDVHTHTIFSRHAYSTIGECVTAAKAAGLELLGSTDHYSSMLLPDPCDTQQYLRVYQHFINFGVWPRVWDGVCVMRGAEADIVDLDGHLFGWDVPLREGITGRKFAVEHTLKDRVFRGLDYVIASIHNEDFTKGATLAQTTNMYVRALEDPKVIAIGHPGRAGVPFCVDEVLLVAKELGKLIEINEHSFARRYKKERREFCQRIAERCAELGVMISVATDAHIACDVGRFDAVAALLEHIHFPTELIATRNKETFLNVLDRAVNGDTPHCLK
ncbi:MAG: phosphatase [Coriobacteriales bacterium]|nr:phosphatase [Coriobacteriales bacterium]